MSETVKRRWRWGISAGAIAVLAGIGVWFVLPKPTTHIAAPEPSGAQLDALTETTVLFGHQSVGANILDGVADLYADAARPAPEIVEAPVDAAHRDASIVHAFVGVNGDPSGKFAAFRELVDGPAGDAASVALIKLCYTDITASTGGSSSIDAFASKRVGTASNTT